jgi:hypothetical protein
VVNFEIAILRDTPMRCVRKRPRRPRRAPILPQFPSGRRSSATSVPPAAPLPPPHLICPQLTGRTPARAQRLSYFMASSFSISLWCSLPVVCGGRVLPLDWQHGVWWFRGVMYISFDKFLFFNFYISRFLQFYIFIIL